MQLDLNPDGPRISYNWLDVTECEKLFAQLCDQPEGRHMSRNDDNNQNEISVLEFRMVLTLIF